MASFALGVLLLVTTPALAPPVWPAAPAPQAETLHYRRQTGKNTALYTWRAEARGDAVLITVEEADATFTNLCAADGATLAWSMTAPPHTRLEAERQGETLHLRGIWKGQPLDRKLHLGDKPWFQSIPFALGRMVALQRPESAFWFLRADELELLAMRAELGGSERLVSAGQDVAAQRVRIRLDKLIAVFWEASYWFRQQNQVFLRYRGVHGPPGTDETIIELQTP